MYAVVRVDDGITDLEAAVTIKTIVPTVEDARREVERLQASAPAGATYSWQPTRYLPNGLSGRSPVTLLAVDSQDAGDEKGRRLFEHLNQAS